MEDLELEIASETKSAAATMASSSRDTHQTSGARTDSHMTSSSEQPRMSNGGHSAERKGDSSDSKKLWQESSAVVASWEALADEPSEGKVSKGGKNGAKNRGKSAGGGGSWDVAAGSEKRGASGDSACACVPEDASLEISPDDAKNVLQVCVCMCECVACMCLFWNVLYVCIYASMSTFIYVYVYVYACLVARRLDVACIRR